MIISIQNIPLLNIITITDYYIDKLLSFDAGGHFNYGRDPGWKVPGRPIINALNNNTIGRPNIYFKIIHITND